MGGLRQDAADHPVRVVQSPDTASAAPFVAAGLPAASEPSRPWWDWSCYSTLPFGLSREPGKMMPIPCWPTLSVFRQCVWA